MPRVTKAAVAPKSTSSTSEKGPVALRGAKRTKAEPKLTAEATAAVKETVEVKTEATLEVKKAEGLTAAYLETLKRVSALGGETGGEVSLFALEDDRRKSGRGISSATLLTHLYRLRAGKKGVPRHLASDKSGGRSNDNERFILLTSGFDALGLKAPKGHPDSRFNVTETGYTVK